MVYSIGSKKVVFTTHSLERIKKRGLTEAWVVDIIKNHDTALPKETDSTQEFRKKYSGHWYYAVVEHKKSVILVITAGESGKP